MNRIQPVARLLALLLLGGVLGAGLPARAAESPKVSEAQLAPFGSIAIQEGGRLKPMDTYARETVRELTGKERFRGEPPTWTLLRWVSNAEATLDEPLLEIRNLELKKKLGLPEADRWHAYRKVVESPALEEMRTELMQRSQAGEKLNALETEQNALFGKLHLLQSLLAGDALTIIPDSHDTTHSWLSVSGFQPPKVTAEEAARVQKPLTALLTASHDGDGEKVKSASLELAGVLRSMGPYPTERELDQEIGYNHLHPFGKAWMLYLLGLLLLLGSGLSQGQVLYRLGLLFTFAGFGMHTYGFYVRCIISGRPPVTNMYESVIWVTWGAVLFALILEAFTRGRSFLLAATSTAIVGLVLADNLPAVLDPSIQPLTPVLRNNFWLTVHVLTITLGYAAFLLGLGLGHMTLWQYLKGPEDRGRIKSLNLALYRTLQIGVLFLAAGTILGGVWANYSWGRFWGWDPKEVWALIALLGYLALLHGRYAGWLRDFGLAAGSILAFMGVMMAWYGVNFVLGAGLHSYGFGTGGYSYVMGYVLVEVAFVGFVAWRYKASGHP